MPPVPAACQPVANDVAALEAADAQLRAALAGLTGAAAWQVLAQIGEGRRQLVAKREELDACVKAHSAAVQAQLVVIDLAPPPAPPGRTAQLWDLGNPLPSQQQSVDVVADSLALTGPLPAAYGISVRTVGEPESIGPDFRSVDLGGGAPPTRIEIVLGPLIKITPEDVRQWLAQALPYTTSIGGAGGMSVDLTISSGGISLAPGQLTAGINGQATPRGPAAILPATPFAASLTLGLVPAGAPAVIDPIELATILDVSIDAPGLAGAIANLLLPAMRGFIETFVTDQLRAAMATAIPDAIRSAFALAGLPGSVTVSLRRLSVDTDGVTLQPALGAVGTVLSTYDPPVIPPP